MAPDLVISKSIEIHATPSSIWNVLINPETIAQYFPGAQTITDWRVGSDVVFIHFYQGAEFKNKGVILDFNPNHLLRYTYWTAFSGTEDSLENYTTITYTLTAINDLTQLSLTQTNFKNAEWYQGLETGWDAVLQKIKELAERSNDH